MSIRIMKYLHGLQVLDDALSICKFLCEETGSSEHCKASVLKLLGNHEVELSGVCWLQPQWIETDITGVVCITEKKPFQQEPSRVQPIQLQRA